MYLTYLSLSASTPDTEAVFAVAPFINKPAFIHYACNWIDEIFHQRRPVLPSNLLDGIAPGKPVYKISIASVS
ncbi:MAG TPA: hypothetical protein DHU69_05400 [Deltaproteobacteria bacterium]|nr:hypothetical protein [Deltaproteobacteria bacterium]